MSDKKLEDDGSSPPTDGKDQKGSNLLSDNNLWRWAGYGIELGGVIGIFCYAGWWADQRFNTGPWLLLTGFSIAFVGMIYLLIKETSNWRK